MLFLADCGRFGCRGLAKGGLLAVWFMSGYSGVWIRSGAFGFRRRA